MNLVSSSTIGRVGRVALGVAWLAAACGKTDRAAQPAAATVTVTPADAAAVNALVPADLKGTFVFEVPTVAPTTGRKPVGYTLAAPRGWTPGFLAGSLERPGELTRSNSDGHNTLQVGSNCDGACGPKDWAMVVAAAEYAQYLQGEVPGTVVKDDAQPTSRTLVFQEDQVVQDHGDTRSTTGTKQRHVIHTWWSPGASRYYYCHATTANDTTALADAWERACSKVAVSPVD